MTETTKSPSQLIHDRIAALGDWRGEMLAHLRSIILATDPDIVEEWKWHRVPVWYRDRLICTGEHSNSHVKPPVDQGPSPADPAGVVHSTHRGPRRPRSN